MQKITPFLWFDSQAEEAAKFYTSFFKNSKVTDIARYGDAAAKAAGRPKGTAMVVAFELDGQKFTALNGGPHFNFNPSVSFHVKCRTKDEVDALWEKLSTGGTVLMELGKYPFSERYGWTQDRYGLSWQVIYAGESEIKQKITPVLMFVGKVCGKAEEAVNFYTTLFSVKGGRGTSKADFLARYSKGEEPDKEGTVKYAHFALAGQELGAMDSAHKHPFTFNEAVSFVINCKTQEEVDYYWEKLSAGGDEKAQQCGWLKDKYGLSWQVVPTILDELLQDKDAKKSEEVMQAMLQMKKIDIKSLQQAAAAR